MESIYHSPVEISNPGGRRSWVLYLSTVAPVRLVVFVHGLGGKTVGAWHEFDASGRTGPWWQDSDLLFVGYESLKERPGEAAAWIRRRLPDFYPQLPPDIATRDEVGARTANVEPYRELVLVGHSLGGVVLRLALLQQARSWLLQDREVDPNAPRPPLLDATLRLFSPASAGFQPAGLLATLTCVFSVGLLALKGSPAVTALLQESELLALTRSETEALISRYYQELTALRAYIMWARPEQVVEREGYQTDYEADSLIPTRKHTEVCKPSAGYEQPWHFVETGTHGA